jgi:hypothetical protein
MGYDQQQQQLAQNLAFRQSEEARMQQQAAEQSALARKYNAQADKPTPPQMWQFGNLMYTHDPDRGFEVAKDAQGNPLEAPSNKVGKGSTKKSVPGAPGYQEDSETGDITAGTIPMPASARASLPQNVAAGSPLSSVPGINEPNPPEQDLPSTLAAPKEAAAEAKDTKPKYESKFTQKGPGAPKTMVMVDTNPDSPTFGKPKPIAGVTEYEKPDKPDVVGPRLEKLTQQQGRVEDMADQLIQYFGGDYGKAIAAVAPSKVIAGADKSYVRNRIREMAKPGKPKTKTNALDVEDFIHQATAGTGTPAPPEQ